MPGKRDPADTYTVTIKVIQSIVLPNGRSYQFSYDGNGYLERVSIATIFEGNQPDFDQINR